MRVFKAVLLSAGLAFALSACHFAGHYPPGHGGVPPGQAKKAWQKPPGHAKEQQSHKRLDDDRADAATRPY